MPPKSSWSLTGVAGGVLYHVAWEGKAEGSVVQGESRKEAVMQRAGEGGDEGHWRCFESLVLSVPGPGCMPACGF